MEIIAFILGVSITGFLYIVAVRLIRGKPE